MNTRTVFLAQPAVVVIAIALLFPVWNSAIAVHHLDEDAVLRHHHDDEDTLAFPLETRIEARGTSQTHTRVKVTLIFPDSGHEVTDWGEVERHGNEFSVAIEAVRTGESGVFPVLTPISHIYDLGRLGAGDYLFNVSSRGRPLAHESFEIHEGDGHLFPGRARLAVHLRDDSAVVDAAIRFREHGWVVTDWGEPLRRGMDWTIHVQAERRHPHEDREHDDILLEVRHRYHLGDIDEGTHRLRLFVNDHALARTSFIIPESPLELRVHPLTEPVAVHPMRLRIKLDATEVDPASLGDHNLRIVGPHGYDRSARFVDSHMTAGGVLVAFYHAMPPGRLWAAGDNGHYRVALRPNSIRTQEGSFLPGQHLGLFEVAIEPQHHFPMPRLHAFEPQLHSNASYSGRLTVALPATNARVEDWGVVEQTRNHFRVDVKAAWHGEAGFPVITYHSHDYHLGALAAGEYLFSLYSRGNYMGSSRFVLEEEVLPRAVARSRPITEAGDHPHLFRVFYASPSGMDLHSIRETSLRVRGPNHFSHPAHVRDIQRYHRLKDEAEIVMAVYAVDPPEEGWTSHANGPYAIFAPPASIRDQAGNYLPGGRIGGFRVLIEDHEPHPDEPSVTMEVQADDDGVHFVEVFFDPNGTGWEIVRWGHLHLKTHTFLVPVEIDEGAGNLALQYHRYRLGRLHDGHYTFVLRASNGFTFRESFVVGDSPAEPFEQWRATATDLLLEEGFSPDEIESRLTVREYAFDLDPRRHDPNPVRLTRQQDGSGQSRLLVSYPRARSATDVAYRIEGSSDLNNWTDVTDLLFTRQIATSPDGSDRHSFDWPPDDSLRFVRVRATRQAGSD